MIPSRLFGLPNAVIGIGGETFAFSPFMYVANLATYTRIAMLRLRMQRFISLLAALGEQPKVSSADKLPFGPMSLRNQNFQNYVRYKT